MALLSFATTSSHQLLDRDGDPAALPWHQPRPVHPLLPVSCVAVRMPGEDHAPQVLSLCSQEWSDPSRGPQSELAFRKPFGLCCFMCSWWYWLPVLMSVMVSVVQMLLVGTGFTQQTEEQYFQFLAKFEIALPVANNRWSSVCVIIDTQSIQILTFFTLFIVCVCVWLYSLHKYTHYHPFRKASCFVFCCIWHH